MKSTATILRGNRKAPRKSTYRFTVFDLKDPALLDLRASLSELDPYVMVAERSGKLSRILVKDRVQIRPRLGQSNPAAPLYSVDGPLNDLTASGNHSINVRPQDGTRFDVYVYPTRVVG